MTQRVNIALDHVLRELNEQLQDIGVPLGNIYLVHLKFADDLVNFCKFGARNTHHVRHFSDISV